MAHILLDVEDPTLRLTLRAMLEREGHAMVSSAPDLLIADSPRKAFQRDRTCPVLLLATARDVPEAVQAMNEGVFGYVFLPFQPGEAALMVAKALAARDSHRASAEDAGVGDAPRLEAAEARHIQAVLRHCNYNRAKAARLLGIGRNTLWRKLKKLEHPDEPAP